MTSPQAHQAQQADVMQPQADPEPVLPPDPKAKIAVQIRLLERDYRLAVTEDERQVLIDAAQRLDARMREIRDQGKIHAADRIAIMAALEASLESVKIAQASQAPPPNDAPQPSHTSIPPEALRESDPEHHELLGRLYALSARINQALE